MRCDLSKINFPIIIIPLSVNLLTTVLSNFGILLFNSFWFFGLMLDSYANDTLTYTGAITGIICCIIIYYMIKKE